MRKQNLSRGDFLLTLFLTVNECYCDALTITRSTGRVAVASDDTKHADEKDKYKHSQAEDTLCSASPVCPC